MSAHTPGPWETRGITGRMPLSVTTADGVPVAGAKLPSRVPFWASLPAGEVERLEVQSMANAHLLAAAPDLLESITRDETHMYDDVPSGLDDIAKEIDGMAGTKTHAGRMLRCAAETMRAAIAKARGES